MTVRRPYDSDALAAAISTSHSWRGVLRHLGLTPTSAGSLRSARRWADELGLDYSHFTGQRTWNDADLASAVRNSYAWTDVQRLLGLSDLASPTALRGHALRLGLDTSHFAKPDVPSPEDNAWIPNPAELGKAGSLLAAAWFTLCGLSISWPLEPCRYDLVVHDGPKLRKVQVKTTIRRVGRTWSVGLRTSGDKTRYAPNDIDDFFVIDGDLECYLIPYAAVGGLSGIHLTNYRAFKVGSLALSACAFRGPAAGCGSASR